MLFIMLRRTLAIAQLGRSDTGGLTYGPAVPMYNLTQCGGLHGHIKVTPRSPLTEANGHIGTVYVPNKGCAGQQAVVVSEDNGVTFAIRPVAGSIAGPSDPSVGIDKAGKIYVAMADGTGRAKVSVSADKGVTWQTATPIDVGMPFGIKNTVFPTAVGGDSGRATVMFLATDTGGELSGNRRLHRHLAHLCRQHLRWRLELEHCPGHTRKRSGPTWLDLHRRDHLRRQIAICSTLTIWRSTRKVASSWRMPMAASVAPARLVLILARKRRRSRASLAVNACWPPLIRQKNRMPQQLRS